MVPSRERGLGQPLRLEAGEGGGPLEGTQRNSHLCSFTFISLTQGPPPPALPHLPSFSPRGSPVQ